MFTRILAAFLCLCTSVFARPGPQVSVVFHHSHPDLAFSYNVDIMPWDMDLYVDNVQWILTGTNTLPVWSHPDETGPLTHLGWDTSVIPNVYRYDYVGRRFGAPWILLEIAPNSQKYAWFRPFINAHPFGGAVDVGQYDRSEPGVYGSCNVSNQSGGACGNLFGNQCDVDEFFGTFNVTDTEGQFRFNIDVLTYARAFAVGDCNKNSHVDTEDLFEFLFAYFGHADAADVNHNHIVSIDDLFYFLAAWCVTRTS